MKRNVGNYLLGLVHRIDPSGVEAIFDQIFCDFVVCRMGSAG